MASRVEGQPSSGLADGEKKSSYGGSLRAGPLSKPLITPKPFSLQRNTTLRSINAPKTTVPSSPSSPSRVSIKNLFPGAARPEPSAVPQSSPAITDAKPTREPSALKGKREEGSASRPSDASDSARVPEASGLPTPRPIERKTSPVSSPAEEPLKITKDDKTAPLSVPVKEQVIIRGEITVKDEKKVPDTTSAAATSDPTKPKTHPVVDQPAQRDTTPPDTIPKSAVTLRRPKASTGVLELKDEANAKNPLSPTSQDPPSKRSLVRNRLSMELTMKFESGGQPLPSLPPQTTRGKYVGKLPTSAVEPEKINPTVVQPSSEKDAEVLKVEAEEDRTGGSSIKRRITLLFDSSSRPEVAVKREEPPVVTQSNETGAAVKDRIKNWALETNADTDNIVQPQTKTPTKDFDSIDHPQEENTPREMSTEETADLLPAVSSAAKPLDDPVETPQSTSPDEETPESSTDKSLEPVQDGVSDSAAVLSDPSSAEAHRANPLKDRTLRRSVRFGTVERDDGKPPVLLGSEPESSAEEEDLSEDEGHDGPTEEAIKIEKEKEREKHEEFMWQKQREEQKEKVTRMEERLRENETFKEAERQKQRQREEEEEAQRERLKQKERELEEDRERVRRDEEMRKKEKQLEEERLRKEEKERESQREEERERQKKEERLRAEERERERQREEERLKEEEREKQRAEERLQAEERERERQREEEREKQRVKERLQVEERERERQREEEREKQRVKERLQAEERESERQREEEREKQRVKERLQAEERERERQREEEREKQRVKERLQAEERERERQREEEREKQRVKERLQAEERERERQREEERFKEEEREKNRVEERLQAEETERERKREEERLKEEEIEKQRDEERWKEEAKERQTLEERLKVEERERARLEERLREEAKERQKVEERLREEAKERLRLEERLREQERERQKMEERLREEELVQERLKKEEMERERQVELMQQRKRDEDRERARQMEERLREEERVREEARRREVEETERSEDQFRAERIEREAERILAVKRERDRLIVEAEERERERQKQQRLREEQERERQTQEALDRKRAEEQEVKLRETERRREEEERERERLQEEQERIKKQQEEEERAQERKEEAARRKQAEEEEVTRQQAVRDRERPAVDTAILISFDSEDVGQKSAVPTALLVEPTFRAEGPLEVPFDDFSVKKPVTEVLFDDFSVTPRRWGSKSRVPQTPEPDSGLEDIWVRRAPDVDSRTHQAQQLDPVKESDVIPRPLIPCLVPQPLEEPRRPYEFPTVEQKKAEVVEEDEDEEVHEEKKEEREGGVAELKEKWNSFSAKGDGLDNEALLNNEPEQQYEDHEHDDVSESEAESPTPALERHSDVHLDELDGVEPRTEPELPAFPESSAPLLDNKALRSRAELRKRMSQRTRRPRTRQSSPGVFLNEDSTSTPDWRVSDNTEETAESNEDEKEKRSVKGPPTSQRSPAFPGLESSHSALVAQLKKKTGGGGGGGGVETTPVKDKAAAAREELAALTPSPSMRSPRSAALLPGAARVLPPIGGKDDGTGSSPSWMQELKKKRMSQQESGS